MQRRAGQMRQRYLQGIKAVVERQERMPAKGDDGRFVLDRQHRGLRFSGSSRQIGDGPALAPLGHGLVVDPAVLGQSPQALLTMLYHSMDHLDRRGAAVENLAHITSLYAEENYAPSKPGIKHLVQSARCAGQLIMVRTGDAGMLTLWALWFPERADLY
jgi:hypothetical protein